MSLSTCHSRDVPLDISLLPCLSQGTILGMSLSKCHSQQVNLNMSVSTCHSWHVTLNMPLLTCHSWHLYIIYLAILEDFEISLLPDLEEFLILKILTKCFKVPIVGTLNLCLETPDLIEKVWAQSDHPVQRKRPKCAKILELVKTAIFNGFWAFSRLTLIRLSSNLFH